MTLSKKLWMKLFMPIIVASTEQSKIILRYFDYFLSIQAQDGIYLLIRFDTWVSLELCEAG